MSQVQVDSTRSGQLRVIIADDILATRHSTSLMLNLLPETELVGTATNGAEAIQLVQKLRPELLIMDVNMPKMDGISALMEIRQLCPELKCLLISSERDEVVLSKAKKAGAFHFLVKPFTSEELVEVITRVIQSRESRKLRPVTGQLRDRRDVHKASDGMLEELAGRLSLVGDDEAQRLLLVWIAELAQVFPVLAQVPAVAARLAGAEPGSAVELRRRALAALRQLLGNLAAQRPLLLEIDDLQWVDADSAALLLKLLEAPPPRLLLALSFRPKEAAVNPALTPYLQRLAGLPATRAVSIDVGPLDAAETAELARQTLRALENR